MIGDELIFVYNAGSGKINLALDIAHKILSPSTYPCKLCDLTFGVFTENEVWKKYRESSLIPMKFYHSDEFEELVGQQVASGFKLPVVLLNKNHDFQEYVTAEEMKSLPDASALIHLLESKKTAL